MDADRRTSATRSRSQWDWTLPVGRGQRFGGDMNPVLDGVIGGWSVNGVGRIQTVHAWTSATSGWSA